MINAQILQDTTSLKLIKKGIGYIYNMHFSDARDIYDKISKSYPEHPVVIFFRGMITYWENYPLTATSPARSSFEKNMRSCIEISEKKVNPPVEADYLLADLCARGILITFYANNELRRDVFPLATNTYQYIRCSFGYTSVDPDFYFFTGIYNYYREAYPKAHPFYKPFLFLFPRGNRSMGLQELEKAGTHSTLLAAESYSILSYIFMSYENNYRQAFYYSKRLYELYPANLEYLAEYIKNLLLMKLYDEADNLIKSSGSYESNPFYRAQVSIFNGILQEKKYHSIKLSEEYFNKGIRDIAAFGNYGNEYAAYAYFGLSRISEANGNKHNIKEYRKKALELADVKKVTFDE